MLAPLRRALAPLALILTLMTMPTPTSAEDAQPTVAVGQIWSIEADPPTSARIIIGRIEPFAGGTAIHVSLVDIPTPAGAPGAGRMTTIGHVPIDAASFAASVGKLLGTGQPLPDFEAGYQEWLASKGGVFTIPVPEILAMLFENVQRQ